LDLVAEFDLVGNDVPDALIAAEAIDSQASPVTFDQGFTRFADLQVQSVP
jgi:predicted nucleic acid-binding protein